MKQEEVFIFPKNERPEVNKINAMLLNCKGSDLSKRTGGREIEHPPGSIKSPDGGIPDRNLFLSKRAKKQKNCTCKLNKIY